MRAGNVRAFAFLLLAAFAGSASGAPQGEWDWGFLASRQRDVDGRMRLRALGPFYERVEEPGSGSLLAVRPFYASERSEKSGWHHRDYLWPVARSGRLGNDLSWRILLTYGHNFDVTDSEGRYRLWILPFYFQGRDIKGRSYFAVFPLGGTISEILNQDRVQFALFPLWARTTTGKIRSWHVFWPLFSRTEGPGVDRLRIVPFYGHNHKRDQYQKRFVMWPFWTDVQYTHPRSAGSGYMIFPLWAKISLSDQTTWMAFPPILRWTRSQQMTRFHLWPFIQYRTGVEKRFEIWPLYGRTVRHGIDSSYVLWPLGRHERLDLGDRVLTRYALYPFLQTRSVRFRSEPGIPKERNVLVWPLASYHRSGADRRFRMLELWPVQATREVERSWAPLWTLLEYRARGDHRRTELLWGFFRTQARGTEFRRTSLFPLFGWERDESNGQQIRNWSILKGLLARDRSNSGVTYRILYGIRWRIRGGEGEEP